MRTWLIKFLAKRDVLAELKQEQAKIRQLERDVLSLLDRRNALEQDCRSVLNRMAVALPAITGLKNPRFEVARQPEELIRVVDEQVRGAMGRMRNALNGSKEAE